MGTIVASDNVDDHVDEKISTCLDLDNPVSFFLFAGAGSGKTGSLVKALKVLKFKSGRRLHLNGQQIGVITYTNKACGEIQQRLDFDPVVEVLTIHSFVWELIKGFNADIKIWLENNLRYEIAELEEQQRNGRASKASTDRQKSIESKTRRLTGLPTIKTFIYSPTGDNRGRDSLNHSEVIKIGADFLSTKPTMQELLIGKFPILLIDESQDTNKLLMEAFLVVQSLHSNRFSLGLLGDTMQRIYADGKADLGQNLPKDWATPAKQMNHRCPKRVVKLINKIRSDVDDQVQLARSDKEEGYVRLFVLQNDINDKAVKEQIVMQKMAEITGDKLWHNPDPKAKILILEHHMAANRMGFLEMYEPLYKNDRLKIGLLDGSLSGLRLFSELVLPLIKAKQQNDNFAVASIIRQYSPLLSNAAITGAGEDPSAQIQKARDAVNTLYELWENERQPTFSDVLRSIAHTGIFEIPEGLKPIATRSDAEQQIAEEEILKPAESEIEVEDVQSIFDAWDQFLAAPFAQIEQYVAYINQKAAFDTHQGVKGLEFDRVMVIIDDTEARGFLFSYEKIFGTKEKTKTDIENERTGKETGNDRTRRLLYVTCSRAEKSLAIVAYSQNPQKMRGHVISQGWFEESEIEVL